MPLRWQCVHLLGSRVYLHLCISRRSNLAGARPFSSVTWLTRFPIYTLTKQNTLHDVALENNGALQFTALTKSARSRAYRAVPETTDNKTRNKTQKLKSLTREKTQQLTLSQSETTSLINMLTQNKPSSERRPTRMQPPIRNADPGPSLIVDSPKQGAPESAHTLFCKQFLHTNTSCFLGAVSQRASTSSALNHVTHRQLFYSPRRSSLQLNGHGTKRRYSQAQNKRPRQA